MLHNLHLQGFKKHTDLPVPLKDGLNYIVGPNYSGKSSVLHSILFALGGVAAVPGGAEVAFGWKSKSTKVDLSWGDYRVVRTKNSGGTELLQGGESIASGITAVNKRLTQLFGMPAKDLMKIIYAEQGSTAALVSDLGEGEVNRLIETLSGVQEVDEYMKVISRMRSEVKGSLAVLQPGPKSKAELLTDQSNARTSLKLKELELEQATKIKADLEQATDALDKAYSLAVEAESTQERIEAVGTHLETLQTRKIGVPWEVEITAEQVEQARLVAQEAGAESHALREQWRASVAYATRLKSAQEEVARCEEKLEATSSEAQAESQAEAIRAKLDAYTAEYQARNKTLAEITAERDGKISMLEDSVCPTCNRPYEEGDHDLEAIGLEVATLNTKIQQTQSDLDQQRKDFVVMQNEAVELDRAAYRYQTATQSLKEAKTALAGLQEVPRGTVTEEALQESLAKVDTLKDRLQDLEQLHKAWVYCADFHSRIDADIQATMASLENYKEQRTTLGEQPPSATILEERQTTVRLYRSASNSVSQLSVEVSTLQNTLHRVKADLDKEQLRLERVAKLTNKDAGLGRLREFLKDNRARFLEGVWNRVLAFSSEVMKVTTGGVLQELSRIEGAFRYREEGSDKFRPLAAASGSQKSIIGIGLKMALAKSLPCGVDFILLDEATSDMDAVHSAALMKYLGGCGLQVIGVTHNQEDLAVEANVVQLGG
jgi:exonuclease SbcC